MLKRYNSANYTERQRWYRCPVSCWQFSQIDIATGIKIWVTRFENKDIRQNMIFQINTTTRFCKALVFTVYQLICHGWPNSTQSESVFTLKNDGIQGKNKRAAYQNRDQQTTRGLTKRSELTVRRLKKNISSSRYSTDYVNNDSTCIYISVCNSLQALILLLCIRDMKLSWSLAL